MEGIARSYFQNLFMVEARGDGDHLLSRIDRCISEEDNQRLTVPYSPKEIQEAIFVLGPTKSSGEDGFSALFYQKCSHVVRSDVTNFFLQICNERSLARLITLI